MRIYLNIKYKILLSTILLSLIFLPFSNIYSQQPVSFDIEANVKLSVCGDTIVEGSEDCEPISFLPFSCTLLGYEGEDILCDMSCSFDLSTCIIPEPPQPPVIEEESIEKYIPQTRTPTTSTIYEYPYLIYFDTNRNGRIDSDEFVSSVILWGEYWKSYRTQQETEDYKCDLNNDNRCDIVDLSILMYHTR